MKFEMKKPCPKCPFRTDVTPYLRPARVREIIYSITDQQQTFSCHELNEFDDDGGAIEGDKTQHCAGALILLEKIERPNQMMRIAERLGMYDRLSLDMEAPVYESEIAMIAAAKRAARVRT